MEQRKYFRITISTILIILLSLSESATARSTVKRDADSENKQSAPVSMPTSSGLSGASSAEVVDNDDKPLHGNPIVVVKNEAEESLDLDKPDSIEQAKNATSEMSKKKRRKLKKKHHHHPKHHNHHHSHKSARKALRRRLRLQKRRNSTKIDQNSSGEATQSPTLNSNLDESDRDPKQMGFLSNDEKENKMKRAHRRKFKRHHRRQRQEALQKRRLRADKKKRLRSHWSEESLESEIFHNEP